MAVKVLPRNKIDKKYKWNAESVYASVDGWEKETRQILEDVAKVKEYQGRLAESAEVLLEAMRGSEDLIQRAYKAYVYASFAYSVETTDPEAGGMLGKAQGGLWTSGRSCRFRSTRDSDNWTREAGRMDESKRKSGRIQA